MTVAPTSAPHSGLLRIEPSLERARELAATANAVPIRASFVDDCETPVSAFLKLREPGVPTFLLESAEQGRLGRYSFIGFRPRAVLRWADGELREWNGPKPDHAAPPDSVTDAPDPYATLREHLDGYSVATPEGLPPFAGRAVGFFAYDLVRTVEPLGDPNPDPVGLPDMALMLSDVLVVFDHLKHTISVLVNVYADDDDGTDLQNAYADAVATIRRARELLAGP